MVTPDLLAAYHATHYRVQHSAGAFTLRTGKASPELAQLLAATGSECAAFITACNPYSLPLSAEDNAAAQRQLEQELRQHGYQPIPAIGLDPAGEWQGEESFLVPGLALEDAKTLGRQYAQNAILWMERSSTPQLVLLV